MNRVSKTLSFGFLLVLFLGAAASAQAPLPNGLVVTFSKMFTPDTIGPGSVSTLRFDITNPDPTPVGNLAFTDTLPAGVTIATPANGLSTCGGTLTAPNGGGTITFSDGMVAASGSCFVRVNVTSATVATHMNVSGDLTSDAGNSGPASDDLIVDADLPGFIKVFSPSTVPQGARSTLTFTIDNTANAAEVTNLNFIDNLPPGMVIASPANASTTCGSPPTVPATLTANPGSSSISLNYVGTVAFPAVEASSSCSVVVDVVANASGLLGNVSGDLSVDGNFIGKASAVLNVTVTQISLIKSFTDDPVPPGDPVTLKFTIRNLDRDFSATDIAFSDDLDAALSGLEAVGLPLLNPCGAGSMLSGTGVLTFSGGDLPPEGSCSFNVALDVPPGAASDIYPNTTSAITADIDGMVTGNMASDSLFVSPAPVLTKTFTDDPVGAGETLTLEFTITNTSTTSMATDIAFQDVFDPIIPTAAMVPADGFCGVGSMAFFTPLNGGPPVLDVSGANLPPSGSCTFSVELDVAVGAASGTYANTTSVITATVDAETVTGNPASDDLDVVAAPALIKEFTDDPVLPGSTVTLEFTLIHDAQAPGDATGISFTDDLDNPSMVEVMGERLTAIGLPLNDVCGTGSALTGSAGNSFLTFTGGTLAPGNSCVFSVTLQVPPSAKTGSHMNTTSLVSAVVLGDSLTGPAASDDITIAFLEFSKEFTDDPLIPGGTGNLRFVIDNTSTFDATAITFTDDLDATLTGLSAVGLPLNDVCGTGSALTGSSGDTFLTFTGGNLLSGEACSFDVTVLVPAMAASGTFNNATSSILATKEVGMPPTPTVFVLAPASDTLTVSDDALLLTKAFVDDPVIPGGTVTLRFTLENQDNLNPVTSIAFSDDLDAAVSGLAATGLPMAGCGGTVSGTSPISLAGGSLAAGASCSFDVSVVVPGTVTSGTMVTNTTSGVTGMILGLGVTGDPASDNLLINFLTFSKAFDGPTTPGGTPVLTYTIENIDPSTTATGISFTDDLDSALSGLAATGLPVSNVCGSGSNLAGTSLLTFSGGTLAPSATCTFNVNLLVPPAASTGSFPSTSSDLFLTGVSVSSPATDNLGVEPPPTFSKTFAPDSIGAGLQSTLTFVIDNTASALAASSLDFTDNLPAGVLVATPPGASTTCMGGTLTAVAGTSVISYTGGTVAAGASCIVQVNVVGNAAGVHVNSSGDLTSSSGNSGSASDTLTVSPPPSFAKSFGPDTIPVGGDSTLTFTIDNTASPAAASSLDFTDNLPAAVVIATPANASTTCTGGTLTATAGSGVVSYAGGTVSAGASCTLSVDVTSSIPGAHVNTSGNLTSSLGPSGSAADTLTVVSSLLTISKAFTDDPVNPGDPVTLQFTIDNLDPSNSATGIGFSDDLDAAVSGLVAVGLPVNDVCGAGSQIAGTNLLTLTGGTLGPSGSCTFSVTLAVPDSAPAGDFPSTSGAVSGTISGGSVTGNSASDTLNIVAAPSPDMEAIPTLSEWGMIILTVLLVSFGLWRLRQTSDLAH